MATLIESTKATYHQKKNVNVMEPVVVVQQPKTVTQQPTTPITNDQAMKSSFIEVDEFKNFFLSLSTIILDCRVLKDYELNHIKNSIHINCRDKITKKRLSTKKLAVKDIINCETTREKLEKPPQIPQNEKLIIIYDEHTNDQNDLYDLMNPLKIVMDNLKHSCNTKICKILKGGFNEFSEKYPELCDSKVSNQTSSGGGICAGISALTNRCSLTNTFMNFNLKCFNMDLDGCGGDFINIVKMTEILPYLYLGNECDSKNEKELEEKEVYYILNITRNLPCYFENTNKNFKYKRISVNDACNENLKQFFEEAEQFIDEAKMSKSKVLVHCQAGISRSPTIVISYLMKKLNLKMNDAYNYVRERRPIIGPNLIFMSQLSDYEDRLKQNSIQANEQQI